MRHVPPQTTKQAKAAHKARNQSALSEAQRRIVERDTLLHRRAWSVKEREKSNAIAAQKRADKVQREQAELSNAARFATQRRVDRFGHKSSQCHLRAFFNTGPRQTEEEETAATQSESFDMDLDDDTLLSILKTPVADKSSPPRLQKVQHLLQQEITALDTSTQDSRCFDDHDEALMSFELDSSTQIAKELAQKSPQGASIDAVTIECISRQQSADLTESSLGLTSQDLEALDPQSPKPEQKLCGPRSQAPQGDRVTQVRSSLQHRAMCQLDGANDFSSTQLEAFLDEDLVLSQA